MTASTAWAYQLDTVAILEWIENLYLIFAPAITGYIATGDGYALIAGILVAFSSLIHKWAQNNAPYELPATITENALTTIASTITKSDVWPTNASTTPNVSTANTTPASVQASDGQVITSAGTFPQATPIVSVPPILSTVSTAPVADTSTTTPITTPNNVPTI